MGEEIIAAIIGLGCLAAVFLPLGICPLVHYYRLTHGLTVTATVAEHINDRTDHGTARRRQLSWYLRLKYTTNGSEHVNTYNVCKTGEYVEAHPVDTEIDILVNIHNPKRFILPEDKWILLLMGGMFTLGGIGSLTGMICLWIK